MRIIKNILKYLFGTINIIWTAITFIMMGICFIYAIPIMIIASILYSVHNIISIIFKWTGVPGRSKYKPEDTINESIEEVDVENTFN